MTPNTPTPSATAPAGQAHTATPWHAVKHDDTQWAICYGGSDFACVAVTSQGNDEANAAHIVHCVNTHSQILAQNAALLKRCEELEKLLAGFVDETRHQKRLGGGKLDRLIDDTRAALGVSP